MCEYSNKKVLAILSLNDKNHLFKKEVPRETDRLIHVYTFIVQPDATYIIFIIMLKSRLACDSDDEKAVDEVHDEL